MKKLTILCDMDSILVNLLGPWLDWYNATYDDRLTIADLSGYHIEKIVKPECGWKVFDFFHQEKEHRFQPPRYEDLPPLHGAVEGLKELHRDGHDIVISTAVAGETAGDKFKWCAKNIPFVKKSNIMVGARKERLHGDVFIDDAPKNIEAHHEKWRMQTAIMAIAYPYNEHLKDLCYLHARCYQDTKGAWQQIVTSVRTLSGAMDPPPSL